MLKRLGAWPLAALLIGIAVAVGWLLRPLPAPPVAPASLATLAALPAPDARAIPDPAAAVAIPGQWTMPLGDYAATRYSALADINAGNVAQMRPVFTYDTGIPRGHEAAPLVVNGIMYLVTPFPNSVDRARPFAAEPSGQMALSPSRSSRARRASPAATSSIAAPSYADGRLFFNTLDGQTIALDAATGARDLADAARQHQHGRDDDDGAAGRRGQVLVGNSGGEMGVRGWLTALDAATGGSVWRAYTHRPR